MNTTRLLLTLLLASCLAAPAFAQDSRQPPAAAPTAVQPEPPADALAATPSEAPPTPAPAAEVAPEPTAAPAAPVPAPVAVAAPAPAPRAAPDEGAKAKDDEGEEEDGEQCVLGDLCLGPVLTLGLPNPLGIGVHARYGKYVGFGIDYQFLPTLTLGDASVGISLLTIDGRLYPFGGAFFLSGGLAYQSAQFSATSKDPAGNMKVKGSITVPAFKLGLGLMGHDGFVMGIDLALEIPLGSTAVDFSMIGPGADAKAFADAKKSIKKGADLAVNALPFLFQLNLLRLGYLF